MDMQDHEVARTLTTGTGAFRLEAPGPGTYRLRSERIGYHLAVSEAIELRAGATLSYAFRIRPIAVVLSAVEVRSETECGLNPERARATLLVWEEIRKALAATAWDGTQELTRYRKYNYERDLTANRRRVQREDGRIVDGVADQPYESLPPERLAREGYVVVQRQDQLHYALPDANVLLSDAFLSTHCFHVVRDANDHVGEVGLAFTPVRGRRVSDVRGTLWLDEKTSELRTLEASYTQLPAGLEDERVGGTVEFLRLPSGAWIVQRWELRTPIVQMRQRSVGLRDRGRPAEATVVGWRDFGGEVLQVHTADGSTLLPSSLSYVAGTIRDGSRDGPLSGVRVALAGTPFATITDSVGAFTFATPLEGEYGLSLSHPWLDTISYRTDRSVNVVRGATDTATIVIPPASAWLAQLCPDAPDSVETGAVVGRVRGPDGASPLAGATVTAWWQTITARGRTYVAVDWEAAAQTDANGRFVLCHVPAGRAVRIFAAHEGDTSRAAHVILPTSRGSELLFAWDRMPGESYEMRRRYSHPFWLVTFDIAARRVTQVDDTTTWLFGFITDAATGRGLEGVTVVLNGRDTATTRADGTFDMTGVEFVGGTNLVTLSRIGYHPRVRGVAFQPSQRGIDMSVSLNPGAVALEPLEVTGEAIDRFLDQVGFYDRQKAHHGMFFDREYIEERLGRARTVIDLLAGAGGIRVQTSTPGSPGGEINLGLRQGPGCGRPAVWIDGMLMADEAESMPSPESGNAPQPHGLWSLTGLVVRPEDVYAIEVYRTPSQLPAQFGGPNSRCGAIVVWTQRGR